MVTLDLAPGLLVARILNGTGRVNIGQGTIMTMQGIGASLSPALGEFIVEYLGYRAAILILGSFGIGSSFFGWHSPRY